MDNDVTLRNRCMCICACAYKIIFFRSHGYAHAQTFSPAKRGTKLACKIMVKARAMIAHVVFGILLFLEGLSKKGKTKAKVE